MSANRLGEVSLRAATTGKKWEMRVCAFTHLASSYDRCVNVARRRVGSGRLRKRPRMEPGEVWLECIRSYYDVCWKTIIILRLARRSGIWYKAESGTILLPMNYGRV